MRIRSLIIAFVLLAGSCFAADVDGKWTGSMATPMGDVPVSLTFKTDGANLTGSATGPDGAEIKIADAKMDGNNISFSLTIDAGGMPFTLQFKGVVAAGQIKFTIDVAGMPMELTVKKTS